jgi:hypothetical protein
MTDDWTDYESGPFCRHYADPWDCDEKCTNCGHSCQSHDVDDGSCDSCKCAEWGDADNPDTLKNRAEAAFKSEDGHD